MEYVVELKVHDCQIVAPMIRVRNAMDEEISS